MWSQLDQRPVGNYGSTLCTKCKEIGYTFRQDKSEWTRGYACSNYHREKGFRHLPEIWLQSSSAWHWFVLPEWDKRSRISIFQLILIFFSFFAQLCFVCRKKLNSPIIFNHCLCQPSVNHRKMFKLTPWAMVQPVTNHRYLHNWNSPFWPLCRQRFAVKSIQVWEKPSFAQATQCTANRFAGNCLAWISDIRISVFFILSDCYFCFNSMWITEVTVVVHLCLEKTAIWLAFHAS